VLDALLDPVNGAIVDDTLSVIEQELFEADWKEAKAALRISAGSDGGE